MGYTKDEMVTVSFGSLKASQNEAFQDGIAFAASQIRYYLAPEADRDRILSFLSLIGQTNLYGLGEDDEECNCDANCGVDGCKGQDDCDCNECEELK